MSLRKVPIHRSKIDEAVRAFVPEGATVVRDDISVTKVKYTVTFSDHATLPAMIFFDYNNDGTTTIEDTRGRNKEFSVKWAAYVAEQTQARLYDTDKLYFESISDERFSDFVSYMSECGASYSTTAVVNGNKYTFRGEYGETLHATKYNSGAILFQGNPSITFNNAISILADIYPSDVILVGLTKYYKLDFKRDDLKGELLNKCPNLVGKLSEDIINAILPSIGLRRVIPDGLPDYSYLCFPLLRGLEGIIKTIFKDNGEIMTSRDNFGGLLSYDDMTRTASAMPRMVGLFPDATEKERVEKLYAILCQQRHRMFHYDQLSPLFLSKEDAIDVFEQTLKSINDAY